jgi:adenylate cyclase class 2
MMTHMALLEIEVKARVRESDKLLAQLAALGCELSAATVQDDTVYVERLGDLETYLANGRFVRIRVQDGDTVILTVKKPVRAGGDVLTKHEHEVTTDSREATADVLQLMGYSPAVRTIKRRRTGHVGDIEVCLDEVEGLGSFIELEKMVEEEMATRIETELAQFLDSLGITEDDRVTRGYDILMLEKN